MKNKVLIRKKKRKKKKGGEDRDTHKMISNGEVC